MRGFALTTDGLFAIMVAIAILGSTQYAYESNQGGENYLSTYDANTGDAALVALYMNRTYDNFGLAESLDTTKSYFICSTNFKYDANNTADINAATPNFFTGQYWIEEKYCGGSP